MSALKDHDNKWSSKRIAGVVILAVCLITWSVDMFTHYNANDFIFGTMFGGALALLGVETVVNGIRNNRNNQRQRQRRSNESEEIEE